MKTFFFLSFKFPLFEKQIFYFERRFQKTDFFCFENSFGKQVFYFGKQSLKTVIHFFENSFQKTDFSY